MENNIQSIVLYHLTNKNGDNIPLRVEVNSWVTLQPGERGGHAKDAKRHGGASISGAYKANFLGFKARRGASGVSGIEVQHAYMFRQLVLNPGAPVLEGACNYLYPSPHIDWIDPKSVMGVIYVTHAEIGEATMGERTHRQLLEESVFFYNAWYHPNQRGYGRIEAIPLPAFNDPSWPLSDMATTKAYRDRLRANFLSSMKQSIGSKQTSLSWFMPLGVMVDLFAVSSSIHKTRTLFVFKDLSEELLSSLMDKGWDVKISSGANEVKCMVDRQSIIFKYHIGRSTLYANFQYNRMRLMDGNIWKSIDQQQGIEVVKIHCEMGEWNQQLEVGQNWTISLLRLEVQMVLGTKAPENFSFWIVHGGHA